MCAKTMPVLSKAGFFYFLLVLSRDIGKKA
jgi:hypothetical protein